MKSLTLVLCVIALLGSAASTFFYIQIGDTKTQLEKEVVTANANTTAEKAKLTDANSQIDALQKRLASLDSDLGETKSKLTTADNRNVELARNVDQLTNQITAKDDAARALNDEIAGLKRDLAVAKLSAVSPEELANYKKTISDLQAHVAELEASKPTITTVAADGSTQVVAAPPPAAPGLTGQVVSIGAQNAFVVVNVGTTQGVQVNQKFTITRGAVTVATAQVSSVDGDYSIAQVIPESVHGSIAKGDVATTVAP